MGLRLFLYLALSLFLTGRQAFPRHMRIYSLLIGIYVQRSERSMYQHFFLFSRDSVTSGIGTAILPLRFGAKSQWDMIALRINM